MNSSLATAPVTNNHLHVPPAPVPGELVVMGANDVVARMGHIQRIRQSLMKENVHYGKPFGDSKKDTLLKPGAEMLCVAFGLGAKYEIQDLTTADEIRYRVITSLYSIASGAFITSGVGEASTNEAKYKWRGIVCEEEFTETPENRRRTLYKKGKDGSVQRVKQVRQEPADIANTVLKMGKKRSYIDATLVATGASDMFEQDIEDLIANGVDPADLSSNAGGVPLFFVKDVSEKSGTSKAGKSYTKYIVRTTDDQDFSTFNKSIADLARELKASKQPCHITFKTSQYGNDLETLEKAAPPPAAKPESTHEAVGATVPTDLTPEEQNGRFIQLFGNTFKVKPTQLEQYLDVPRDKWEDGHRAKLKRVLEQLTAGDVEVTDIFG